jgi:hypothetical protein
MIFPISRYASGREAAEYYRGTNSRAAAASCMYRNALAGRIRLTLIDNKP